MNTNQKFNHYVVAVPVDVDYHDAHLAIPGGRVIIHELVEEPPYVGHEESLQMASWGHVLAKAARRSEIKFCISNNNEDVE